ncbi:glycosyltransferase [Williamsia sp. MIQD14]|uniref:glycosyltransferase n=1 Tax=Williamsia sp. MIQD14 TaxID=3425703 RepID=UPI003DA1B374
MRILFSSLEAYGHTFPLVPLALAAQGAGHTVHWAVGERLHPALAEQGFTPWAAGMSIRAAFERAVAEDASVTSVEQVKADTVAHRHVTRRAFTELIPRSFETDLAPVIDRVAPDLIVAESAAIGAVTAAQTAGIDVVTHGVGRGFAFDHDTPEVALLDICPPSLQHPDVLARRGRVPLRPIAFAADGPLPPIVLDGDDHRPLVYVTLGTEFGDARVLGEVATGIASLGTRVLIALGPSVPVDALGPLPEGIAVEPWVPQAAVLHHASAIVHHGGSGTTLAALAAGLPQLLLPQGADQFDNAAALADAGLATQLIGERAHPESVRAAVGALLAPTVTAAQRRRAMVTEIESMPSPDTVVADLRHLAEPVADLSSALQQGLPTTSR